MRQSSTLTPIILNFKITKKKQWTAKTRPLTLCRIPKTLTSKTCLFFVFFLELNFSFFRHFAYLHLCHISYPVLLTLFAVAAILNTSPSSLETRDLLCARVFSRAAAVLKSEKTLGTRLSKPISSLRIWFGTCQLRMLLEQSWFVLKNIIKKRCVFWTVWSQLLEG